MPKPSLKILLVEKSRADCEVLLNLLGRFFLEHHRIDCVSTYDRALSEIREDRHDVYLIAHQLGEQNGVDLLRQLGAGEFKKPFILLTGPDVSSRDLIDPAQVGATECLEKETLSPALFEGIIHSCLKRKEAEQALRESEERFRFMTEKTGDVLYRLQYATMTYDYLSPVIEKLTGYTVAEIGEFGFSSLVERIDLPNRQNVAKEVLIGSRQREETGEYRADYLICKKNGEFRWLRDHSYPWYDESGKLEGSTGILSDVTELKEAEESLRESEKELRTLSSKLILLQEEERERLARELHDGFGQTLIAIKYGVEAAIRAANTGDGEAILKSLRPLVSMVQHGTEEVRKLYMSLRPTVLDDFGIIAAIDWFSREFEKLCTDICIEKETSISEEDVPEHLRIVIYRIMQEAVENSAKHSQATKVTITLKSLDHGIELAVKDNGTGFDPKEKMSAAGQEQGLGIASMRERAKLSGGLLHVNSGKHSGTVIRAEWPKT